MLRATRARPATVPSALAAALCCVLLSGCTGGAEQNGGPSTSGGSGSGTSAPAEAADVPLEASVVSVAGNLPEPRRQRVRDGVTTVVEGYLDAAFVSGDYPRTDFDDAFSAFTRGAARRATRDRDLLTNASIGATTTAVTPLRKRVRISVLAPKRRPSGATAHLALVFRAETEGRPPSRVRVSGRLFLLPARAGEWRVFGYDVARSAVPADEEAGR